MDIKLSELEKKYKLLEKINWDYNYSVEELLKLVEDSGNNSNERLCFFIKSLETFTWQELIYLWNINECNKLYTEKVRKGIFSKTLREKYDGIFKLLRNKTISRSERSAQELERFKASLLFNRRNCTKQGIF